MSKVDAEREKRLAEALRQNLRRRKAQAREAVSPPGEIAQQSTADIPSRPGGDQSG